MNHFKSFLALVFFACVMSQAATTKTLIDYFKPIPITCPLVNSAWGCAAVGPRDTCNGIEDPNNYYYWDGKIIKQNDTMYHLFCSRWPKSAGVPGWMGYSVSIHATSKNILGPYRNAAPTYTYQSGKGHNTTGLTLKNGTYAVLESAIVPGWMFTSSSLSGPFSYLGSMIWNGNGFNPSNVTSNLQICIGPDSLYWAIGGSGFVLNSDTLLGTYTCRTAVIYAANIPGMSNNYAEDPVIWYSGGYYHCVYDYWNHQTMYHLMSADGIHNWVNMGLAGDSSHSFIRYTDSTHNHWHNVERPNVYMENGHVAYFTFAVTDIDKNSSTNPPTSSKVIVVPFDGVSFDADNTGVLGDLGAASRPGAGIKVLTGAGSVTILLPASSRTADLRFYDLSGRLVDRLSGIASNSVIWRSRARGAECYIVSAKIGAGTFTARFMAP